MPDADDPRDLLALHLAPGLGPKLSAALLSHFGSAQAVLRAGADQLAQAPLIGPKRASDLCESFRSVDVEAEVARIERAGVRLVPRGSPGYPPLLAAIDDAPLLLYVRGELGPPDVQAVAVVGSRECTDYGVRVAQRLAAGLARAGVVVVSGLARGIDGAAHRATVQAGGRTLAVLAGGLSRIYPPEHRGLAEEVARSGALLTESRMDQEPLAGLFPARNRIISGLCRAVVLVEAAEKSGALHTATHAAEQGRTVLAVPGPVDSPASAGCHALLRQGVVLCRGVDDVLEELAGLPGYAPAPVPQAGAAGVKGEAVEARPARPAAPAGPPPGLEAEQLRVWEFLGGGPRSIDEMAQQLGRSVPALSGTLMQMEIRRVVRRLPGNRYQRA